MGDTTEELKDVIDIEDIKSAQEVAEDKVANDSEEIEPTIEVVEEAKETQETEEEDATAAAYLERLQRTMAEFDNYRKRTDKEKSAMYDMGLSDTVLAILPVLDNFERALVAPCEDQSYVKGMEMIYKQMIDLLASIGITQIETVGQKFDTNVHNAAMHVEDENYGENEIVEEFQKGYIYKDEKVIRYSMVKVAN